MSTESPWAPPSPNVLVAASLTPCPGRFSMLIENGVVKALNVEPDGTGLTCSLAPNILSQL